MVKRKNIYKWLYQHSKLTREFYMLLTMFVRQPYYTFTGRREHSRSMITEHFNLHLC